MWYLVIFLIFYISLSFILSAQQSWFITFLSLETLCAAWICCSTFKALVTELTAQRKFLWFFKESWCVSYNLWFLFSKRFFFCIYNCNCWKKRLLQIKRKKIVEIMFLVLYSKNIIEGSTYQNNKWSVNATNLIEA